MDCNGQVDRCGQMARWKNNVALAHPYHEGSHVASLVKFHPVV